MFKFTENQNNAIYAKNESVIVSASAGSGKTSVLVERVINLIKSGTSVNRILIVTFTNASANEMKERIKVRLLSEKTLKDQLNLLDKSFICTIDSFCMYIFKKYVELDKFEIADKDYFDNLINYIILSNLNKIHERYDKDQIDTINAINNGEEFDKIISFIKESLYTLSAVDEKKWMNLLNINIDDILSNYIHKNMNFVFDFFEKSIEKCSLSSKLKENYLPFLQNDFEILKNIYNDRKDDVDFIQKIKLFNFSKLKPTRSTEFKEYVSLLINKIKNIIESIKKIEVEYENIVKFKIIFIKILKDIILEINQTKQKYKYFEFGDIEQKVLNLLSKNNEIRICLKNQFDFTLIDEYQDVNEIQDSIFTMISKKLFLVGDYKQSIYGFRGSNPNFFINKKGMNINLNINFRSQKQILCFINECFENLMKSTTNMIEYNNNMKLKCCADVNENICKSNVYLYMLNISNNKRISNEIRFVLTKIKELLADQNNDFKLSDFCIMMRNYNKYENDIFEIFEENNIKLKSNNSLDFIDCDEIKSLILLLKIVKDPQNDFYFIPFLLSNIFNFDPLELLNIKRNTPNLNFYNSIKHYIGLNNDDLSQKCELVIKFIDDLQNKYKTDSLYEFVSFAINKLKEILCDVYDDSKFQDFLRLTNEFAQSDNSNNVMDLIDYVKNKKAEEYELNLENDDAVLVTSIHKTKGQEYRVCFLVGCSDKFKKNYNGFISDPELGFSFKINKKSNLEYSCLTLMSDQKKIEEEMRILYVALTRAKEKLYVILSSKDAQKDLDDAHIKANAFSELHPYFIINAKNFAEWFLLISCKSNNFKFDVVDIKSSPQDEENVEFII